MNKQELIEQMKGLKNLFGNKAEYIEIDTAIELASKLDEPQKVTIPQFVADWYEEYKDNLEYNIWDWMKYNLEPKKKENAQFSKWIVSAEKHPVETLIKMKLYGYTVEKEKKYKVKFKNIRSGTRYLKYDGVIEKWYFGINQDSSAARLCHTKKELEEAGFGWVFDCEGIEIEEVEG